MLPVPKFMSCMVYARKKLTDLFLFLLLFMDNKYAPAPTLECSKVFFYIEKYS